MRRLVCNTLEYWNSAEISDHRFGLICPDHGPVRSACQTFQRDAVFLWHATKEEAFKSTRTALGKDFRLTVKRLERIGGDKVATQQNRLQAKNSQTTFLHISLLLVEVFYYLSQH